MAIPTKPLSLMRHVFKRVFPIVNEELSYWYERAKQIPNDELRKQAIASIEKKTFHCEGGSILSLLGEADYKKIIKFIVAYQTISDYLDNLCDRSTSLDAIDFEQLHLSMKHSVTVGASPENYYCFRKDQNDGGYLEELVATCQSILEQSPFYGQIKDYLIELCQYYCDLQVHKHVTIEERESRLMNWFQKQKQWIPEMEWYEFSACSGSTLGIFCLVSYSFRKDFPDIPFEPIKAGYFPYIQGLHILLDYFIDQEEDQTEGDLNFCSYYSDSEHMAERLVFFFNQAEKHIQQIPHAGFHRLINRGLLGVYLSDLKVAKKDERHKKVVKQLLKSGGATGYFFYWNRKAYEALKKWKPVGSGIKVST
ncbi:MAG TPA: tetraprenyl-beta-curcumene synthase family protein [Bacillus sp. (in: firmicutes)]|uniref:tetraprenyl-beta-curcumene synthase family protein n=1 Tax=Bacillus litorisediminis TaxID=2922713 RepID=UPI001FAE8E08|nr:tetraprenyl-beta-curcumene synthase family protein [Bacillus litorisediminis]HWO75712.1 tetraprenyl-beta-curcumene synthase family protein [Bacillus sp. (in: firmicutes)]